MRNVEVSARYYQVAMASGDRSIERFVVKLLVQLGQMKFARPLYRVLIGLDYGVAVDISIFPNTMIFRITFPSTTLHSML